VTESCSEEELLCFPRLTRALRNSWRRSCGSVMHCLLPVKRNRNRRYVWKKLGKYTISLMHKFCLLYKSYNIALKSFFLKSVNSVQILYKTCAFCGYRQCLYTIFFSQVSPWWYMFKNA
jgi:hypothetical protein